MAESMSVVMAKSYVICSIFLLSFSIKYIDQEIFDHGVQYFHDNTKQDDKGACFFLLIIKKNLLYKS